MLDRSCHCCGDEISGLVISNICHICAEFEDFDDEDE